MVGWLIGQARMNALQPHRIASIILLLALSAAQALAFPVLFSDQGTDAKSGGVQVNNGDLTVQIWDSATGGTMVYGETFTGAILNGSWNVILGQSGDLQLEYGLTYYKEYQINGQDLDFTTPSTGTTERLGFTSPLGAVNMSKLMQVPNKPNIDAANITGGTILDARINNTRWVNYSNAACIALTGSADLCDGSDATSAGGAQQPNIDAANITSGTILNARYNLTFFDGAYVNEGAVASKPNIDASNVTSGVMQNPRYNSSFVVNYSNAACIALTGSADLCDGVDATSAGGASQPNIDAANITSGAILNARYNTSYILNQTYAANTYSPLTHNHISVYLNYSDSCPSGQIYEWGFGCVSMPSGGAAQPNIAGQNITSGLIGWQFLPQTTLNTTTCGAGFYYLYGSGCTPAPSSGSSQPNIDALNITSGVILNARYNSTYLMNYTACGSNQYWVYNSGCTAIPSGSAAQPNVDAANITGGTIANARYNLSYLAQAVNITDLWGNASNQDVRITTLEGISVAVPYWASFNGNTTSNLSINEGNVHISGRLSMNTSQAVGDNSVALGSSNKAYNYAAVGGGVNNIASGDGTVISGGANNGAYGQYSTVSGGNSNTANVQFAVVSGGDSNSALDSYAVVSGGIHNFARSYGAVVSGGAINIASGEYSVVLGGRNVNATGNYSLAYGDRVQAGTNVGNATEYIFAFGYSFTNPTSRSFAVGFGDITLNVTDNLVKVVGDVNATGVVCDGAGNCLNMIGGPANANNITQLWGNLSSTIVNYTALRGNVSAAVTNISALQGNVTGLWSNASNQDTRIISLEGRALQPLLDAANVTSGVFVNVRYNSSFLLNKSGTLTDTKVCTYSSAKGTIDCNSDPSTYDDSRVVANITFLWGNLSVVVVNITALQVNVTNLWTNASNQDTRIIALEGAGPANSNNITQLWGNLSSTVTNVSALRGNVSEDINNLTALRGNISSTIINVTALQGNVTNLWSNASNQDTRIISLEGAGPANSVNITQLWGNVSSVVQNLTGLRDNVSSSVVNISALQGNVTNLLSNASNQDTRIIALEGAGPANSNNITQLWGNVSSIVVNASSLRGNVSEDIGNLTALRGNVSSLVVNVTTLQGNVTNLWSNASNQDTRIISLEGAGPANSVNITQLWGNLSSTVINLTGLRGNVSEVVSNITSLRVNVSVAVANISALQGNVTNLWSNASNQDTRIIALEGAGPANGNNITQLWGNVSSVVLNITGLRDNVSSSVVNISALQGNVTNLWSNASNQDARIILLETNIISKPYWVNQTNAITSNSSINGGNVNVTGNLTVTDRLNMQGSIASGIKSVALGSYANATGVYSFALGSNISASASNSFAFGEHYTNPSPDSFTVGFTDITLNVSDNLLKVTGDVNATGRVCDGAGNCLNNVGNASAVPYWANLFGSITSNASLSGGNVNVTGNLKVMGRIAGNGSNAAGANAIALGFQNNASGDSSTVSGGSMNNASDLGAVVSGGWYNTADGAYAVVAGGFSNDANGSSSVVSGGEMNTAKGYFSVVSGGWNNLAAGEYSLVLGGLSNNATGKSSVILGGDMNLASGNYSIAGGNRSNATFTNSVALGNGAVASGRDSYSFGQNSQATAGNSYAFGRDLNSTNAGAISFGNGFANPVINSFAVGFGDITANITDNLLWVRGDINATGRICDGSGNCLSTVVGGSSQPNIDAANITSGVIANARYNASYLFNKSGVLTDGQYCTFNLSIGTLNCNSGAGSSTVTDQNISDLWYNASIQEFHIRSLQASNSSLWGNASNQDARIITLESKSGGLKPNIDAANITTGVVANARYNATYLFNKDGALTHGKFCTYNSSLGSIDCSGDSATYDDSRVVSNITQLWGNLSSAVVNITRLQANATSLWANASNQDQRIMTLEGNPASTPLWITQNLRTTSNSTINSGNVNVTGSLQAPSISTHTSSADGLYSAAFGFDAHATADYSLAVGNNIDTTGANSYSLGKDYTNNQDRTFKVGWDSTPTLKVNETEVTVDGDLGVSGLPFGFYDAMHIPNGMNGTYLCSLGGSVIPGLNYTCIGCKFTDGSGGATCNTHTAGADKMCMCRGSKSL